MKRTIYLGCVGIGVGVLLSSCGSDTEGVILTGQSDNYRSKGEALYQQAKLADQQGKDKRAIKLYDEVATVYPIAADAGQARLRQAQLLDQRGETEKAFKAYSSFVKQFPGSSQYKYAMNRQAEVATAAAEGNIQASFLGMKRKVSVEKSIEMLEEVASNSPKSKPGAKAQLLVGRLHQKNKAPKEAIAAYRKLVEVQPESAEAAEAMYLVGETMMEDAKRGNQNQANIDLAKEAFQDYLLQYPRHYRCGEARNHIASLGGADLQRSLDVGDFYLKTGKTESAKVYYRDILKRSSSGKVHDEAKARLKQLGE